MKNVNPEYFNYLENAELIQSQIEIYIDRLDGNGFQSLPYSDDFINYSINSGIDYNSTVLTVNLFNEDDKYSLGNTYELKRGFPIKIIEKIKLQYGISILEEQFDKFLGYINTISAGKSSSSNSISLYCLDKVNRLAGIYLSEFEKFATKVDIRPEPYGIRLQPAYIDNNGYANIFDFVDENNRIIRNIAESPAIIISIIYNGKLVTDKTNYEINYSQGQLILKTPIYVGTGSGDYEVYAKFSYYLTGLYIEDLIKELYLTKDFADNQIFTEDNFTNTSGPEDLLPILTDIEIDGNTYTPNDNLMWLMKKDNIITYLQPENFDKNVIQVANESITITSENSFDNNIYKLVFNSIAQPCDEGMLIKADTINGRILSFDRETKTVIAQFENSLTVDNSYAFSIYTINLKYGYIILQSAINYPTETVYLNTSYTYYTLQSTGVQIPFFKSYNDYVLNVINKLFEYLAPNYIIRSIGDKVVGQYMRQKSVADCELKNIQSLDYIYDKKIYTKVELEAPNPNPNDIIAGKNAQTETSALIYMHQVPLRAPYFYNDHVGVISFKPTGHKLPDYATWMHKNILKLPREYNNVIIDVVTNTPITPILYKNGTEAGLVDVNYSSDFQLYSVNNVVQGFKLPDDINIQYPINFYGENTLNLIMGYNYSDKNSKLFINLSDSRIISKDNSLYFIDSSISPEIYQSCKYISYKKYSDYRFDYTDKAVYLDEDVIDEELNYKIGSEGSDFYTYQPASIFDAETLFNIDLANILDSKIINNENYILIGSKSNNKFSIYKRNKVEEIYDIIYDYSGNFDCAPTFKNYNTHIAFYSDGKIKIVDFIEQNIITEFTFSDTLLEMLFLYDDIRLLARSNNKIYIINTQNEQIEFSYDFGYLKPSILVNENYFAFYRKIGQTGFGQFEIEIRIYDYNYNYLRNYIIYSDTADEIPLSMSLNYIYAFQSETATKTEYSLYRMSLPNLPEEKTELKKYYLIAGEDFIPIALDCDYNDNYLIYNLKYKDKYCIHKYFLNPNPDNIIRHLITQYSDSHPALKNIAIIDKDNQYKLFYESLYKIDTSEAPKIAYHFAFSTNKFFKYKITIAEPKTINECDITIKFKNGDEVSYLSDYIYYTTNIQFATDEFEEIIFKFEGNFKYGFERYNVFTIDNYTLSFYCIAEGLPVLDWSNIADGNYNTYTQLILKTKKVNYPLFYFDFFNENTQEIDRIDYIDITYGAWYPDQQPIISEGMVVETTGNNDSNDTGGDRYIEISGKFALEYSDDLENWYPLSEDSAYFDMSTHKTASFEFSPSIKHRYIRLVVKDIQAVQTDDLNYPIYPISIIEFRAYSFGKLYVSKTLDLTKPEENELYQRYGEQTYKKTFTQFLTKDILENLAQAYLDEFKKEDSKLTCNVIYSPHIEIGDTVSVNNENYFVEALSNDGKTTSLTLARYVM